MLRKLIHSVAVSIFFVLPPAAPVAQTSTDAAYAGYMFGRALGKSVSGALRDASEYIVSKQELSDQIARARERFWKAYRTDPASPETRKIEAIFLKRLFAKDYAYLQVYLLEGPYSQRAKLMANLGGPIENGRTARPPT
jgi:hypothetical protein